MKKIIPKILTITFLLLLIIQTGFFLYLNLFNEPVSANNSVPYLQVDIPTVKFLPATVCGNDSSKLCINWIGQYIKGIYKYAVGVVGIVASVILIWAGISYMTAGGSADKISNAKSWIGASLSGLVLVLASYTLLSMVNPGLVNFAPLKIGLVGKSEESVTKTAGKSDAEIRALLNSGIKYKDGISLKGLQPDIINEINALANQFGAQNITITSGTEGPHAPGVYSHANGYKVDIRSLIPATKQPNNLSLKIWETYKFMGLRSDNAKMYQNTRGSCYAYENDHWDVLPYNCPPPK